VAMIRLTVPALEQRRLLSRFWRDAAGFWRGSSARISWSLATLLVAIVCLQLLVQFWLNLWQRDFYDALNQRHEAVIWGQALVFVGLVTASTALTLGVTWGRMTAQRCWRNWLTEWLVRDWLAGTSTAQQSITVGSLPSPEYRIAEDANVATQLPIDFAIGLLSALLGAGTFIGVLWSVGGGFAISVFGTTLVVPGYLVLAAVLYAGVNTASMLLVGRRMVLVIEEKNQAEAELRQAGTYLREVSEGSRPPLGAAADGRDFRTALGRVSTAWKHQCSQLMRVLCISQGSSLSAPLIALALCVPKYLADALTLGEVMQLASAFVIVQTAFNWLVDNYARMAEWLSSVNRVALLLASLDQLDRDAPQAGFPARNAESALGK
jgi:putative ATP-binding cassette transporter